MLLNLKSSAKKKLLDMLREGPGSDLTQEQPNIYRPTISQLIVARVTQDIPKKGNGKARILVWDDTIKSYTTAGANDIVDVYDVLPNNGLGPVSSGNDILIQPGNGNLYELVQATCEQDG